LIGNKYFFLVFAADFNLNFKMSAPEDYQNGIYSIPVASIAVAPEISGIHSPAAVQKVTVPAVGVLVPSPVTQPITHAINTTDTTSVMPSPITTSQLRRPSADKMRLNALDNSRLHGVPSTPSSSVSSEQGDHNNVSKNNRKDTTSQSLASSSTTTSTVPGEKPVTISS
jgi:hypothetical protein